MTTGGVSPVPREARPYQGQAAGVVTRGIANTIDGLVVVGVMLTVYLAFNGLRFLFSPRSFQFSEPNPVLSLTVGCLVSTVYLTAGWAATGRTYGCHVMGLRVIGANGGRLWPPLAFVRAVLYVLFPVGLLWCAVSRDSRSLQDLLLRTWVVYDWMPRHEADHARDHPQ